MCCGRRQGRTDCIDCDTGTSIRSRRGTVNWSWRRIPPLVPPPLGTPPYPPPLGTPPLVSPHPGNPWGQAPLVIPPCPGGAVLIS